MDTTICPNPDVLADYVLGRVSESDLAGIASHVEACPACQSQLEAMDGLSDTVIMCLRRAAASEADRDDSLLNEVLSRIESITSDSGSDTHDHVHEAVLPRQIGQYRLVEKLGHGSMGDVYKAFHTKLKRTVAVKLLPAYRQRSPEAISRFHREMEAVGRVDHPNIVRAHDAGEAEGQFFLVMEFVEGVTFSSLVRRVGPLAVADACDIVRQAAVGLQHAHEHGLVHRDVKPSNLMLTTTGVVKVLDLGLARLQVEECGDGEATASGQIMGTADYMAPEQGSNPRDADARADVYALGCTLYFFLAGRPPFGDQRHSTFLGKVMAHANEGVVPIDRIRTDVPGPLAAILAKLLAKSPANRFSTAAEVAESLTPFCAGSDLVELLTNRLAAGPIKRTAPGVTDSCLPDSRLKSPAPSASPVTAATHKAWQIGLRLGSWRFFSFSSEVSTRTLWQIGVGLALLATAGLWYGIGFLAPRQGVSIARYSPGQDLKDKQAAQRPRAQDGAQHQGQPKPPAKPQDELGAASDYIVLHSVKPTVVGVAPNQRVGFPNTPQMVFDSDSPRFLVPEKMAASGALNITRLFLCRDDCVPMAGVPNTVEPRKVNLWVPAHGGPYAQAIPQTDGKTETSTQLQPTRPLPDGVYCLHTGTLAGSQPPPEFCCPFIVRGYGIPRIEKATAEVGATDVKLTLVVRNSGLGEFNDGFIVATIQKQAGSRFEFQGRRHLKIDPIPAKGQQTITSLWETAGWKPGRYHFHGAINYEELWDANRLATFDTDDFAIGGRPQLGEFRGEIFDQRTQKGIAGATVLVAPGDFSAKADASGHYRLPLPAGEYLLVTMKADGFLPQQHADRFVIEGGRGMNISGQLQSPPATMGRTIRLRDRDTFHFLAQKMYAGAQLGGDFYLSFSGDVPRFWANGVAQSGLMDLGDIGSRPLEQVAPPATGYERWGVAALEGHTYVALAQKGEEGHYVIFRVTKIAADKSVEIEYDYR